MDALGLSKRNFFLHISHVNLSSTSPIPGTRQKLCEDKAQSTSWAKGLGPPRSLDFIQAAANVGSAVGWKAILTCPTLKHGLDRRRLEWGAFRGGVCCPLPSSRQQGFCQPQPRPESHTSCSSEAEKSINSFSHSKNMSSGSPWGVCLQSLISVEGSWVGKEYGMGVGCAEEPKELASVSWELNLQQDFEVHNFIPCLQQPSEVSR